MGRGSGVTESAAVVAAEVRVEDAQCCAAYGRLVDHLVPVDPVRPSDVIFCFGSRDDAVPARAAALHAGGVAPLVVVSGGGAGPDGVLEADRFARLLAEHGVPSQCIVVERRSRHTGENVVLGLGALDERSRRVRTVVSVSWPLAARRCRATFARHASAIEVISAPAIHERPLRELCSLRTVRRALDEWDRLSVYAQRGFIVHDPAPPAVHAAAGILRSALADLGG